MALTVEEVAMTSTMDALRPLAAGCTRCDLSETRIRVVFGSGPDRCDVMFIGEAPGRTEDEGGTPFSGAAGRLLDEYLAEAGLTRDEVFITSVLKCRPPKNRNPRSDEMTACSPLLMRQIELIDPAVVVLLGSFAVKGLLGVDGSMSELRGTVHTKDGRVFVPVYHPAAALYDRSKHQVLLEDFSRIARIVSEVRR